MWLGTPLCRALPGPHGTQVRMPVRLSGNHLSFQKLSAAFWPALHSGSAVILTACHAMKGSIPARCALKAQFLHSGRPSSHIYADQEVEVGLTGNAEVSQPRTEMTQPWSSVGSTIGTILGIPFAFEQCEVNSATLYVEGDMHCFVGGLQTHSGGSGMPL